MSGVLRTQLSGVARRPARLLLTGLAILVVSFVVYATVLAQQITERSVLDGLSGTPAAADLVVADGAVTTGQLTAINEIAGVAETAGRVDTGGQVGNDYLQLSSDPGSGPLALTHVVSGVRPTAPGQIVVTPRTLSRMGLKVGSTVRTVVRYDANGKPGPPAVLTVVGVADVPDDYGSAAYAPLSTIVRLTGENVLNRIDVRLQPGADRDAVRARIDGLLTGPADQRPTVRDGADVRHDEAEAKASDVDDVFAVIGMFVAIAVVAAGLVATSTFRIVFAQRMRQLALLRAIGAGRRALGGSLAAEGALTGLLTGLAGVVLALGAGHLVPAVLGAFGKHVSSPGLPLLPAAGTVLLAVVITVVAVLAPAFSAARVAPLEALRSASTTGARRDIGKLRWAAGLLLVAAAALLAGYVVRHLPGRDPENYDPRPMLLGTVASGAFAFFALIALGPVVVRPVLAALAWPVRRTGSVGKLAAGGVGGAPRRAAAVSVVVALGVTLIAGVLVGGASIRVLADRETASSAPADYELTQGAEGGPIPAAVADQVKARTELTHVTPYRRIEVKIGTTELEANDVTMTALPELDKLDVVGGSVRDLAPGKVIISGFTTEVTGLHVGDVARVVAGKHSRALTVVAMLPDSAPLGSAMVLDPADLTALGAGTAYAGLLADAATGGEQGRTDGLKALTAVNGAHGATYKIDVLADERDEINANLDTVLFIALGLISLTVLIAVVGVGTTTALSVVERARESGLLRALGLSRGGLRIMLTTESALYGVIGAAIGLVLGVPYAWLAVEAIGVNAPLRLPVGQLAGVFVALVLLTALAGVLPARRAATVSPVTALGAE